MREKPSLAVRDLAVARGGFHLRRIALVVAEGEYFVLLGPTGAGKTVLLETIAGLHRPCHGQIFLEKEEITNLPPERRGIGFVYQDYALFPHLTLKENLAFGLRLRRLDRRAIAARIEKIAQLLGIEPLLSRKPGSLSGGEQQRGALARALVLAPRLLLLDEPLSALDPETHEELQRELSRLHRTLGTTTLHVTHDFEEAVALGDRIGVMHEGEILQVGSPEEIFRRPASSFVARFVGTRNVFQGEILRSENGGTSLQVDGADLSVVTGLQGPVHASIRPEDILISREPLSSSARNLFCGRITGLVDRGILVYVSVSVPPQFTGVITRRSFEEMNLREGMEVYIAFKASAVHVF